MKHQEDKKPLSTRKDKAESLQTKRTSIKDLSIAGYELSEEHLQFVSGGLRSAGTCSPTAQSDDD